VQEQSEAKGKVAEVSPQNSNGGGGSYQPPGARRDIPALPGAGPSPCVRCSLPRVVLPPPDHPQLPVESKLEYLPYEKVVLEMQRVERREQVPREVWVTEYDTVRRTGRRPVEKTVLDYYEVEHITEYVEDPVTETRIEMVEQEIIESKVSFLPVERSVVHYPLDATAQSQEMQYPGYFS
jgi:hypothetical protein